MQEKFVIIEKTIVRDLFARLHAYRQFILARHGHLGKGNRTICPSCLVLRIKRQYRSLTGVYMGYRERSIDE